MKSYLPREPKIDDRTWYVVDAQDKPLGRLATEIANVLRGKDKPTFSPQVDTGAFVVVVNAEKIGLSGRKEEMKIYQRYSGHRSGLKKIPASAMRAQHPDRMIKQAVRGMLPRNTLGRHVLRRLKVYAGGNHPHEAQNPRALECRV